MPTVSDVHMPGIVAAEEDDNLKALRDLKAYLEELLAQFEKSTGEPVEVSKPLPNEHVARQADPKRFTELRRKNAAFGAAIDVIYGILDGKSVVQSIRFDAAKFTPDEARAWLKAHDFSTNLEPAVEKAAPDIEMTVNVVKAEDDAERVAYAIAYPVMPEGWSDSQHDRMDALEIRKAAHKWMQESKHYDIQHTILDVPAEEATVVESFLAPMDMDWPLPDGTTKHINKGSWIVATKFGPTLWAKVKSGFINAYSIRGYGVRTKRVTPAQAD